MFDSVHMLFGNKEDSKTTSCDYVLVVYILVALGSSSSIINIYIVDIYTHKYELFGIKEDV